MAIKNIWSAITRVGPQILISLSFVLALGLLTLNFRHLDTFRRSIVLDCPDFSLKNSDPTSKFRVHREVIFKEKVNSIQSSSTLSKDVQTHIDAEVFQDKVTKNDENDCPPYQFVMTTDDGGRLGNQMSEYATLIALSTLAGYTPFISKSHQQALVDVFPSIPFEGTDISQSCKDAAKLLNPRQLNETQAFLAAKPKDRNPNVRLQDYPNGPYYFSKIKGVVMDHFNFKPEVDIVAENYFQEAKVQFKPNDKDIIWVGIHVRRADYGYHLNVLHNGRLVKIEFFERAIARLKKSLMEASSNFDPANIVFVIASDDVEWCRTNFGKIRNETFLYSSNAFSSELGFDMKYLDMCIMSKCNHSIFDYGTFGFWGAYLADGHTVLAHNMGTSLNNAVENIKNAQLANWQFIEAHVDH